MKKIIPLLAILLLAACKQEKFPPEPSISFVSLEKIDNGMGYDDKATLTIHFEDGDGDIGLNVTDTDSPYDTSSVYYYNWFIDYYKKIDGEFQKIEFEGVTFNQRIPRLSNSVPESIEGNLFIDLNINDYNPATATDTILFKCRIVDRALHESNEIETTPLVVRKRP
ncbi:MAG: hypothetical protein II757_06445 [Bacteroidales bacterium]|nr:hypothetical protein [Bacteroidales bacterium]